MKFLTVLVLASMLMQEPVPQQPAPAPPAQPAQQPPAPVPAPDPDAQRRAEYERQQQQMERQREAELRRKAMDFLRDSTGTAPSPLPRSPQPYIAPVMQHDSEFDWNSIPLTEWLAADEVTQIPWKVEIKDSALRMDQRIEVSYTAKIQAKELNKLVGAHELFFLSGVSGDDGKWLTLPKVVRQTIKQEIPEEVEVRFSDAVFTQPGNYLLWLILYDRETEKHSVEKRRIEVSQLENDPLPKANIHLPPVELPRLSDREGGSLLEFYGGLLLPVSNKRPLRVELISVLSAPEQWSGRQSIIRSHNEHTAAALNTLSQMQLAEGSLSLTGLDIVHRKTPFQQSDYNRLDWAGLAGAFKKIDNHTVSAATLQAKGGGAFFRESVNRQLAGSRDALRVFIVVSSSLVFGQGSDRQPIKLQGDCHCRVYHLRFRHNLSDMFDDLEKLIKPLRPKTFNVAAPRDLRKAIAEIIRDLEGL